MNTFIVIVTESFDQYDVEIPIPFVTFNKFENIYGLLEGMEKAVTLYNGLDDKIKQYIHPPKLLLGGKYEIKMEHYQVNKPRLYKLEDWVEINNINKYERAVRPYY